MNRSIHDQEAFFRSAVTSLVVCAPALLFCICIIRSHTALPAPTLLMAALLGVGALNFGLTVALEYVRRRIGRLTLPAILGMAAVMFLFVLGGSVNRFVSDFNYQWLLPAVGAALALSLLAIFREKALALKLYLAFNALALSVLWGLGATGQVWLPF